MVQLSENHLLGEFETQPITVREALEVEEQSWMQVIDQNEFRIPEYQRNYSWERSNRTDFWDTLENKYKGLEPLPNDLEEMSELAGMYMGAIYVAEPSEASEYNELDIVDGQQRLATFQLLLKALYDYCNHFESKAQDEHKFDLKSELTNVKSKLNSAFSGTEPSVVMNSEDREFFAALAAYPDNWHTEVRDILEKKWEENQDEGLSGQNRPRVKTVQELIDMIQAPLLTDSDVDLKQVPPFSPEESGDEEEGENDENGSILNDFIRFETSHERMFDAYAESYQLIERLHDDLSNGGLEEKANVTMNFTSFLLHSITVDRCLITKPNPDLRLDIFQSINDKGRPLHNVDKIRARIKHRLVNEDDSGPMDEWRNTLKRLGGNKNEIESMLVYFVASTEDEVDDISSARSELMNVFDRSNPAESNVEARLTNENAANLVTAVSDFSKYYKDLRDCELRHFNRQIDDANRQEIKRILDRVGNKIGASQWYALGPYIYMQTDKKMPGDSDKEEVGDFLHALFDAIEVVTLRQSISDRSGAAIEGTFVGAVQGFRDRDTEDKFNSSMLVSELAENLQSKAPDLFEDGMIYQMVKNRAWTSGATAQCVLQRTTSKFLAENDIGLSVKDYSDIQVEHILPQSPISDRSGRSLSEDDIGEYAWLEYFFKTSDDSDSPPIADATQILIDEEIPSLKSGDIDSDALSDEIDEDDIEQIQDEVYDRFIDDISNLLLLVDFDNLDNSNDLLSKKLPVYSKDDYLPVVVNDFFNGGGESDFAGSEYIEMQDSDFEVLESDDLDWDSDAAERVDKSWTYDVMFERKSSLVYQILQYLTFDVNSTEEESSDIEDEFKGLQKRVKEAVDSDKERRIGRRAF